jgi:ATPase family associated with various cellular activities (AAA)
VAAPEVPAPYAAPTEHLFDELGYLELLVKRQVERLRSSSLLTEDDFRGLYIADAQVDALLGASESSDAAAASIRDLDSLIARARAQIDARTFRSPELPLIRLARAFDLTPVERGVVLVALAPEVDLRWETLYAYVQNDVTKRRPTVDLALKLCCADADDRVANRGVFARDGTLIRERLLTLVVDPHDPDPPLLARYAHLEERIAGFLLGQADHDGYSWEAAPRGLAGLVLDGLLRARIDAVAPAVAGGGLALFLEGPPGAGKRALAGGLAATAGRSLMTVDLASTHYMDGAGLRRDALLHDALLYVEGVERLLADDASDRGRRFLRDLDATGLPLVLGSQKPWDPGLDAFSGRLLSIELDVPGFPVRLALWERALEGAEIPRGELATIADTFRLGPERIGDAVSEARQVAALRTRKERTLKAEDLRAAARAQSSRALHGLAEKVEPLYGWPDIVVPARVLQGLQALCTSVRYRHVVYSEWGFGARVAHGRGLNALFSGPSGTGKTMAAQIIARELGLDLYAIDLSTVVSKYIGETERNLRRIFRAAEWCNAILFFDEADALFGKRSEVRDAHDRYANIEVAYLLQQMEQYDGIVILATNLAANIDEAFTRRLEHAVDFPFPEERYRREIWRRVFPAEAPLADDVDLAFLAQGFELSGGNIRNVAFAAAFAAAEAGTPIAMEHLIRATARELDKLGQLPSRAQFRDFYELVIQDS